ncbi:hypothetical protein [Duganella sp. HH101]|uniref:hypothetical protein n=1 Tax=Duganella sp. HH101 TaxID=1781066 RepID=UPI0008938FA9|nr:hypothetical protein [Duganella sp. HH101]OFA00106.1 hypothetical protein DUGA2_49380 [Duganella sp. HH101]
MSKFIACTPFINILVKVRPGVKPGTYKVETMPAILRVSQTDTIINYQIFDSGNDNIVFTGMTVVPEDNDQFSEESISISGKQLTFCDANTSKMTLNIMLHFKDDAGVQFMHDPQVENEPEGG